VFLIAIQTPGLEIIGVPSTFATIRLGIFSAKMYAVTVNSSVDIWPCALTPDGPLNVETNKMIAAAFQWLITVALSPGA
jgi:hypothetical protein